MLYYQDSDSCCTIRTQIHAVLSGLRFMLCYQDSHVTILQVQERRHVRVLRRLGRRSVRQACSRRRCGVWRELRLRGGACVRWRHVLLCGRGVRHVHVRRVWRRSNVWRSKDMQHRYYVQQQGQVRKTLFLYLHTLPCKPVQYSLG